MIGSPKPCTLTKNTCILNVRTRICDEGRVVDESEITEAYRTIGVSPGATPAEIRSAYRRLARRYHPDLNPGNRACEEKFKAISAAYQQLRAAGQTDTRRSRQVPNSQIPDPRPWSPTASPSKRRALPRWMVVVELTVVLALTFAVFGGVGYLTYLHMVGWLANGETVLLFSLLFCAYLLHVVVEFVGRTLNPDK